MTNVVMEMKRTCRPTMGVHDRVGLFMGHARRYFGEDRMGREEGRGL